LSIKLQVFEKILKKTIAIYPGMSYTVITAEG
jgi:hypothetical protein